MKLLGVLQGWVSHRDRRDTALLALFLRRGAGTPCRADTRKSVFDPLNKVKVYVGTGAVARAERLLRELLMEVRAEPAAEVRG